MSFSNLTIYILTIDTGILIVAITNAKRYFSYYIARSSYPDAFVLPSLPQPCHPPSSTPAICPFSPSLVTTCPCTKTPLSIRRTACTDPIPTCSQRCGKAHSECGHACTKICHTGPCPPCKLPIDVKCRCGETTTQVPCNEITDGYEVLCQRPCRALRGCGRHACNRICCPLAGTASKAKGKRRVDLSTTANTTEDDPEGWHVCDLVS